MSPVSAASRFKSDVAGGGIKFFMINSVDYESILTNCRKGSLLAIHTILKNESSVEGLLDFIMCDRKDGICI